QNTRGISVEASGFWTTIAGVGGVVGSLTGGYFSDWLLRRTNSQRLSRQGIAVAGMAFCSLLILLSYLVADIRGSITLVSLGAFSASFGGVSGYAVAITFGGSRVALVFSIMNMCGNLGAALFPITAGRLVDWTGSWNLILFLFAGIMAIDAICWAFLNPKEPLFPDNPQPEMSRQPLSGEARGN
ncbi:MAG: MFS transporter, partial [Gemmataceae bacterium]